MEKIYKIIITVFTLVLLASCTQSIRTNVSRFHMLPAPSGQSIVIVPSNPAYIGSIEFATYATMVGNALGNYGYVPANGVDADLIVELDYGVDEGKTMVRASPYFSGFMGYGGYYGGYFNPWFPYRNSFYNRGFYTNPYYLGGMYDPFGYYSLGMSQSVRTYVNYNRYLKMVIKPKQAGGQNLFEGEVKSTGRNNHLNEIMPYLVQAFFVNFPGQSGSSEKISIEIPKN